MNKFFACLIALCLVTGAATGQQQVLTTTFAGGNGQMGNCFDIAATGGSDITICGFDCSPLASGTYDIEVYTHNAAGTYQGSQNVPANWTLAGSATGIPGTVGTPMPTTIQLAVVIPAGQTQGFYVTFTNGNVAYTNGTTTGAVHSSDANITFYEGSGHSYPFGSNFNPRVFNGNINYTVGTGGCAAPPPPPWQTNSAISSLDVGGVTGSAFSGAVSQACQGGLMNLNSLSTAGTMTDIAVTLAPHGPSMLGSNANNTVNIDIFDPSFFSFNGGTPNFAGLLRMVAHPGVIVFPIPTATPLVGSAQQVALDASNGDGYTLSQAPQANVTAGGLLTYAHADDGFIVQLINQLPLCGGTYTEFYGVTFGDICSQSNGWASFGAGSTDFSATAAEWQAAGEGRFGLGADLEPNNYGTVTLAVNGPAMSGDPGASMLTMSYSNITEWGTGGLGVTSYDLIFNGPQGNEIANFTTDGTWSAQAVVVGMSKGSSGTHPALVSFDALSGTGMQAGSANDSWLEENPAGMVPTASGWSNISWPTTFGDACIVQ